MRRSAFTVIELLVVVGILFLLASILVPAAANAYHQATRVRTRADLAAIALGLEAYRADFGDYPRPDRNVPGALQGSVVLCWGLIAPGPDVSSGGVGGDGANGPGFRVRGTSGKIFGPYLSLDRFRLQATDDAGNLMPVTGGPFDDLHTLIVDRYGQAILYYPKKAKSVVSNVDTYFGLVRTTPRYVFNDNNPVYVTLGKMQALMPGVHTDSASGSIYLNLSEAVDLPYLVWSGGPDGQFGTPDDVTNFQ